MSCLFAPIARPLGTGGEVVIGTVAYGTEASRRRGLGNVIIVVWGPRVDWEVHLGWEGQQKEQLVLPDSDFD